MIRDRNISPDAAIQMTKLMGGGVNPCGKTYYAIKSGTEYATWVADNISNDLWRPVIQDIIDKDCVDGKPDTILVGPGKWTENNYVLDKEGLSIHAMVEGWFTRMRPSDATTKLTFTPVGGVAVPGVAFAIMDRSVSLSGFLLDGGGGYCGLYIGDGYRISTSYNENSASARIRGITFAGQTEGVYGCVLDGCSADVIIENCIFDRNDTGLYISPGGTRTVQRPIIRRNEFVWNDNYGIAMYSSATTVGVMIRENAFIDDATAMTYAVLLQGAGYHALLGNYFACTNKWSASSTDIISGNYGSNGGDGSEKVSEA